MNLCDPMTEKQTAATNDGVIARWSRHSGSRDVQLFGPLQTDLCNVPIFLLPRVQQIKLTKPRPSLYLMDKTADSKSTLKFVDSFLMVRRVKLNPLFLSAYERALTAGALATLRLSHSQPGRNPDL